MQIETYLQAQVSRNNLKLALKNALGSDLSALLSSYGKKLNTELDKLVKDRGLLITASNLQNFVDDFASDLLNTTEADKLKAAGKLESLYTTAKASLDITYPVDTAVLPKVVVDDRRIINEFNAILEKYRTGKITESRMRKLLPKRLNVPTFQVFTAANTQIAGWDNAATKAICDLAFLKDYWYHGPDADPEVSHTLCIEKAGGVYTEGEINGMNNGQGLSVWLYVGGYNCLHELIPCNKNWSELKELRREGK